MNERQVLVAAKRHGVKRGKAEKRSSENWREIAVIRNYIDSYLQRKQRLRKTKLIDWMVEIERLGLPRGMFKEYPVIRRALKLAENEAERAYGLLMKNDEKGARSKLKKAVFVLSKTMRTAKNVKA